MSPEHREVLCCGTQRVARSQCLQSPGWGSRLKKSLLLPPVTFGCFQSCSPVNPLGSVCTGAAQRKYFWRTPRRNIGFWFQLERHRNSGLGRMHVFIHSAVKPMGMSGTPGSGFPCMLSMKWQFPAWSNGFKLTNQGIGKQEHIWSPGEKEASNLCRNALSPVSQWEARLRHLGFLWGYD